MISTYYCQLIVVFVGTAASNGVTSRTIAFHSNGVADSAVSAAGVVTPVATHIEKAIKEDEMTLPVFSVPFIPIFKIDKSLRSRNLPSLIDASLRSNQKLSIMVIVLKSALSFL